MGLSDPCAPSPSRPSGTPMCPAFRPPCPDPPLISSVPRDIPRSSLRLPETLQHHDRDSPGGPVLVIGEARALAQPTGGHPPDSRRRSPEPRTSPRRPRWSRPGSPRGRRTTLDRWDKNDDNGYVTQHGYRQAGQSGAGSHVNVGRTASAAVLTGGVSLLFGASPSTGTIGSRATRSRHSWTPGLPSGSWSRSSPTAVYPPAHSLGRRSVTDNDGVVRGRRRGAVPRAVGAGAEPLPSDAGPRPLDDRTGRSSSRQRGGWSCSARSR